MENENDALDLLLSLQSEDLSVESPRSGPDGGRCMCSRPANALLTNACDM